MAAERSGGDEVFPKGSNKSFALVELVRGETPMVDRGPEDTEFSFPMVLLWEVLLLLGVSLAVFLFSLLRQAPLEEIANPFVTTDPAKAPGISSGCRVAGAYAPDACEGGRADFADRIPGSAALPRPVPPGVGTWFASHVARIVAWTRSTR
jgi:hypothetical protein